AQGTKRDEPDTEFLQRWKDLLLRLSPPQRVLALKCRHRLHGLSPTNGCCAGLRHTEMFDLTFAHEVPNCTRYLFNRYTRIDAMLIQKIDHVGLEPLQGGFCHGSDPFRLAVRTLTWNSILEAELRRDNHLLTNRCQRLADKFFVCKRTVRFGSIEEGHAAVVSSADYFDSLILFHRR